MLRFCIVGAGFIGGVHAQALAAIPEAAVTVVCSRNEEKARAVAEPVGAVWVNDYRQAVARPDVDVVCICTPSGAHAEIAEAAAAAGKHLVVEKPIEITLERVDRIIAAAQKAGVKLTCIFPLRFMQGPALTKQAIEAGRLGRLALADAYIKWYRSQSYYDTSDWKGTWALDGGGALMNQGIHHIDLLNYLAGPVNRIVARTATLAHQMETEDTAVALLAFANGSLGTIEGSTASWPGDSGRIELHGDKGTIALEDGRIVTWQLQDAAPDEEERMLALESQQGSGAAAATGISYELHRRQLADMIEAILKNRPPAVTGAEARHSVAIIRAIYESHEQRRWIEPA
ncbi:MAG: Gfo/Idh/MocA family oxidoreductase [Anaerolineales bacterium]|nr:Gfo/Idh/MocA family oxidoreductase [Anaerolineales bacterium]